jgi:hypothetical protein
MTDKQKIDAMARLDGWKIIENAKFFSAKPPKEPPMRNRWVSKSGAMTDFPDYFEDNEIDRMVRGLSDEEAVQYYYALSKVLVDATDRVGVVYMWDYLRATKAQKVEAYLKCKELWE